MSIALYVFLVIACVDFVRPLFDRGKRFCYIFTHLFNGPFSRTTQVSGYQKGKTNLDFTEARDSE